MAKTVTLTAKHIELIKRYRFFTHRFSSLNAYLEETDSTGWLRVGTRLSLKTPITIEPYAGIYSSPYVGGKGAGRWSGICTIGTQSYSHSPLPSEMKVGRHCSIGEGLKILDSQHPIDRLSSAHFTWRTQSPLVEAAFYDAGKKSSSKPAYNLVGGGKPYPELKNDVWIGQNATLSMGITIGNGAIVAANSMVTKSVPDYAIVGGNPAKLIRYRFEDATIERLLTSSWWDYSITDLNEFDTTSVETFLEQWEDNSEVLEPYSPELLVLPDDLIKLDEQETQAIKEISGND